MIQPNPAIAGLTYNDDLHEYRMDGELRPSVTQLLAPLVNFGWVNQAQLEWLSNRGTAVHESCHLDLMGTLDEASVDDEVVPFLAAFRAWRKSGYYDEILQSEVRVDNPLLRYSGTADLIARTGRRMAVVDIKTCASLTATIGIQLAGYAKAWDARQPRKIRDRVALQLKADGSYRMKWYNATDDFTALWALRRLVENPNDEQGLEALDTWRGNHNK